LPLSALDMASILGQMPVLLLRYWLCFASVR